MRALFPRVCSRNKKRPWGSSPHGPSFKYIKKPRGPERVPRFMCPTIFTLYQCWRALLPFGAAPPPVSKISRQNFFSFHIHINVSIDQIENNVKKKSWLKAIFDRKARLDRESMLWSLALLGLILNILTLTKETG